MIFWLSVLLLTAAILFGGGSRVGFFGDVLVQFIAIPLLLASMWRKQWRGDIAASITSVDFPLVAAAALLLVIALFQLLPMPNFIAGAVSASAAEAGIPASWGSVSVSPTASWAAIVSMLPSVALFAGVSQLDAAERLRLTVLIIGLGMLGLMISLLQMAQGSQSALRFFEFTNSTEAVGFFANRNHFAAFLFTTLVFAAVWLVFAIRDIDDLRALGARAMAWLAGGLMLLIAIIAGVALTRSRAGLLLALIAIVGIVAMAWLDKRPTRNKSSGRGVSGQGFVLLGLGLGVLFAAQFGAQRIMSRFETDVMEDLRIPLAAVTVTAALDNLPFGTGLGSFVPVYSTRERPDELASSYANRAHNDWAEFFLETGLPGLFVLGLFFWWLGGKGMAAWRRRDIGDVNHHLILQRGAVLVIGLLAMHSFVDYPLRTTAMATLFAFACALLIEPVRSDVPWDDRRFVQPPRKRRGRS